MSFIPVPSPICLSSSQTLKFHILFLRAIHWYLSLKVSFKTPGRRGNGYVANLYKISATKYRFRLWAPDGTRLNTVTQEDATPPSTVIAQLVDLVNSNATFNNYIHVTFLNETTEAMSDSTDIGDGQTLDGGR